MKQERKHKFVRSIASSVLTLGTGLFAGVPLGTHDYDKDLISHKVFTNIFGNQFAYNNPAEVSNLAHLAAQAGDKLAIGHNILFGASHALGHGLPAAETAGILGAIGYLIGKTTFDKVWPKGEMTPPPHMNMNPQKTPGYPEYPSSKQETKNTQYPEATGDSQVNKTESVPVTEYIRDPELVKIEREAIKDYLDQIKHRDKKYYNEVMSLNKDLPSMKEDCQISIIMPARGESTNILEALELLTNQTESNNKSMSPDKFEILILVNRPNSQEPWDNTLEKIDTFKKEHPQYHIYPIKKTFDFASPQDVKMGKIFKTIADLSLVRSLERSGQIDRHLIMPTGADYINRNKDHFAKIFDLSKQHPDIDQFKNRIDLPREAYLANPLLHVDQRMLEYLMLLLYNSRYSPFQDPERIINGESVYSAKAYALSEGYNPERKIAEDLDLTERIKKSGGKVKKSGYKVITSPRRKIKALEEKGHILYAYNNFFGEEGIKKNKWTELLSKMNNQNKSNINKNTLDHHMSIFFDFTLQRAKTSRNGNYEQQAITIFQKAMRWIGVDGKLFINREGKGRVQVTNFEHLKSNLQQYKTNNKIRHPL